MKNIGKGLSILLAAILIAASLAGCANSGSGGSSQGSSSGDSQEAVTLRFVNWQSNFSEEYALLAQEYNKLNPNVTVVMEYVGDMNSTEYLKKVDLMLLGGENVDIVGASSATHHSPRALSGQYLPLDDFFAAEGVEAEDIYTAQTRVDGKTYAIFTDTKPRIVLINKDMLDEANLPVPPLDWTWDDYREYAQKLTKGEGADKVYGSYFHAWSASNQFALHTVKVGSQWFDEDGQLFLAPAFKTWMQFRYDLENVDKTSMPLSDIKSLNLAYRDQFFGEKVAMLPMGSFMLPEIGSELYPHDFITTFAPLPVAEGGTKGMTFTPAIGYSIAKNSKHPQEAYDFLRYMTTEGVNMLGIGFSAEEGADKKESIDRMLQGAEHLVDIEALERVMNNPDWQDNVDDIIPEYFSQIDTMILEETDMYLLDAQTIDDMMKNIEEKGQKIIDEASK
ncbi:MAG: ABC transporter substrate-binding protein [Christensenellales bacterium]|jgi:multiple sugar transport system substrate-binding protein